MTILRKKGNSPVAEEQAQPSSDDPIREVASQPSDLITAKIADLNKQLRAQVVSPWDGKREIIAVNGVRLHVGGGRAIDVQYSLSVKCIDRLMQADVFDATQLLKDGVIEEVVASSSVSGNYRLAGRRYVNYSTGIISVDAALTTGGFRSSFVHRIWGPSQSCKSVILYKTIIRAWELHHKPSLIIAGEYAFDEDQFASLGGTEILNEGAIKVYEPGYGEDALDETCDRIRDDIYAIIGIDSLTVLRPRDELDKPLSKVDRLGSKAHMQTRFLEKVLPILTKTSTALICTVQSRPDTKGGFGSHDAITGTYSPANEGARQGAAAAVEFYVRQSLKLNAPKAVKRNNSGDLIEHVAAGLVDKNLFGPRGKTFEFRVNYNDGVADYEGLVAIAIRLGIITLRGRKHIIDGVTYNGGADLVTRLKADSVMYWEFYGRVYSALTKR